MMGKESVGLLQNAQFIQLTLREFSATEFNIDRD